MARTPEFDQADILNKAMTVFWTKGYRDTSVVDLEQATGLKPGSLYNAFGSKKGLFLKSVDHYVTQVVERRTARLLELDHPIEAIDDFFRTAFENLEKEQLIGCLLTNTATEFGSIDPDIQMRIRQGLARIETAFQERLVDAQTKGLLAAEKNPAALAVHLLSCYQGFGVIGRLTRDKERLTVITEQALLSLR